LSKKRIFSETTMALVLNFQELKKLKEYAETHRFTLDEMYAIQRGECPQPGGRKEHCAFCPIDYKIVFSVDQTLNHRWVRHMSMSRNVPDRIPNEIALREVCQHLGFKDFDKCLIQKEQFHKNAIEVLEYLDETTPSSNEAQVTINDTKLKLAPLTSDLFHDIENNLLIKMYLGNPICVASFENKTAAPLTPEKIEVCKRLGISYVDISK
jgi:hypothetical protein